MQYFLKKKKASWQYMCAGNVMPRVHLSRPEPVVELMNEKDIWK